MTAKELTKLLQDPEVQEVIKAIIKNAISEIDIRIIGCDLPDVDKILEYVSS